MEDTSYETLAALLAPQTQALQAIALRPQKTSMTSVSTTTPYARDDMIARRDAIGAARRNLAEALRPRETFGYTLANTLAALPQQQGYGTWLGDAARAFGGAFNGRVNAAIDRAQKDYEAEQKDLALALAFDKAMGDTVRQTQTMGYTPMEFSGVGGGKAGATAAASSGGGDTFAGVPAANFGRSVGYDPIKDLQDFNPIARAAATGEQFSLGNWLNIPGTSALAKGIAGKKGADLQTLYSDITDNILSGKVLDFIGKAGSIRIADTPEEQKFIFGPLRDYQSMSAEQLRSGLDRSRNNFVATGLQKAKELGLKTSETELKNWFNSAFTVPESLKTETRYNVQDRASKKTTEDDWDEFWSK